MLMLERTQIQDPRLITVIPCGKSANKDGENQEYDTCQSMYKKASYIIHDGKKAKPISIFFFF